MRWALQVLIHTVGTNRAMDLEIFWRVALKKQRKAKETDASIQKKREWQCYTWTNSLYKKQSKMSSSKRDFLAAGVNLSEAPSPHLTPYPPPPLHTVYVYTCILIHTGKGGRGGELTREKVRGATVHKAGSKIPTLLTLSPVYKLW